MKASEFIRVFGLEKAKKIVSEFNYNSSNKFITSLKDNSAINIYDLKRLVESHELVSDYYGLTRAKEHAESNYTAPELKVALKQAIADVESCKEVS